VTRISPDCVIAMFSRLVVLGTSWRVLNVKAGTGLVGMAVDQVAKTRVLKKACTGCIFAYTER
jgi:hypothetical protein